MKSSLHAASLFALALTLAPVAMAGDGEEKHACCAGDKAKTAKAGEKCDPKSCPPGKCDKHTAAASKGKTETAKPAPKPATSR